MARCAFRQQATLPVTISEMSVRQGQFCFQVTQTEYGRYILPVSSASCAGNGWISPHPDVQFGTRSAWG